MASSAIHLAVAKQYLKNNKNLNYRNVIAGSLYPDAVEDNDKSHYTDLNRGSDNVSHIRGKVNLYEFLKEHEILNDFELGWFLHLVTDYLFFEECFTTEYLLKNSYKDFCKDLYFAYNCLTDYLEEKYNITKIDYQDYPSEYYPGIPYEECIISKNMIDKFINRVSVINITEYIEKIKKDKKNVTP